MSQQHNERAGGCDCHIPPPARHSREIQEVNIMTDQHRDVGTRSESTARAVASWIAWHAGELAAVGIPAVAALTLSAWLWGLVALAGGVWAAHEIRQVRQQRALVAELRPAVSGRTTGQENGETTEEAAETEQDVIEGQVRHG
ncbi:hypothetical protein FHX42_004481 [Saccharopolyspora lacisalsi]|uniref:Uncharacterized protein n=1 Tax=Halosaccharopolyspora lacisalsi TaxID=1000566 RepID=A0A839E5U5_9PSEU|nr:hypothetical protein [Halosaccharopolyspora lacisalsi]MBA8827097.1 hypothetical protein [Halosaccharopolyspora lacisalsi]